MREDHTFIRFTGQDAATWLHSQTTNDVNALEAGQGQAGALLDRQGRLQAHFTLHRWDGEYWMLIESGQAPSLLEKLDAHLFVEDVAIEETGAELDQVVVQGPRSLKYLARVLDPKEGTASERLPRDLHGCRPIEILGHEVLAFRVSETGEDGYLLVVEKGQGQVLLDALAVEFKAVMEFEALMESEAVIISPEAREILRIEAGIPRFGIDVDETCPIPETTLERTAVSDDKGCYLGQEVVARLRTYGSVKHALMGLVFETPGVELPQPGTVLFVNGAKAGRIMSGTFSPTLDATIAMAFLDRGHRRPGDALTFSTETPGQTLTARVVMLPFYEAHNRTDRAKALYDEALARFGEDLDDVDVSAIPLLEEAILLHPACEDAYEVLGVILHRHHRLDEAIHTMERLARLNPGCLMAHSNLSVFYMEKGLIEKAEEEKAKAAVLGIRKVSDERRAKEIAEEERRRLEADALERIATFEEVLEIDPEDPVAAFGLGQAYVQRNEHEKAIPHFEKAGRVQKDFSAAYLNLGKCHEFLGRVDEAITAYQAGIAAATRKGDLMPLKEMERRLEPLTTQRG